jgi:hypothetical protein
MGAEAKSKVSDFGDKVHFGIGLPNAHGKVNVLGVES